MTDMVRHPGHYSAGSRVPGIECIKIARHFDFNLGNAIKYIWRAGLKGDYIEDLRKAMQYLEFAIELEQEKRAGAVPAAQ